MPLLTEYTLNAVSEHLGELSQFVAEKTNGDLIVISLVVDVNLPGDIAAMAIVGTGSNERMLDYLTEARRTLIKRAASKTKPEAKAELDDLLESLMKSMK